MEVFGLALVLLVVLLVGGVRVFSAARREAQANAPQLLDKAFDGRPMASFTVAASGLPFEQVVVGARERGYRLDSQSGRDSYGTQTLVFVRDAQS